MADDDLKTVMTHEERADLYQFAMSLLCQHHGGEMFVKAGDIEGGTLMHRFEKDGIRFRFVADPNMPDIDKLN